MTAVRRQARGGPSQWRDGIGLAEKMLGLPGLVVREVHDAPGEVVVWVGSTRRKAVCPSCRRPAEAQDRVEVHLRDLHCFGRPCRLVISKRRWRCRTKGCVKKTWTEKIIGIAPRQVLTTRAGAEVILVGEMREAVMWVDVLGVPERWASAVVIARTLFLGAVPDLEEPSLWKGSLWSGIILRDLGGMRIGHVRWDKGNLLGRIILVAPFSWHAG